MFECIKILRLEELLIMLAHDGWRMVKGAGVISLGPGILPPERNGATVWFKINPLVPRAFLEGHYFFSKFLGRIEGGRN